MRRSAFCLPLVLAAALAPGGTVSAATDAPVARGLIVRLQSAPDSAKSAESVRERLAAVAQDSALPAQAGVPIGDGRHLLRFDVPLSGAALAAAERRVRLNPQVAEVEPDVRLRRLAEPNDPYYANGAQWYLRTPAAGGASAINLPPVWAITQGRPEQVIALVDTGVDPRHPDLAGKLLPGYDMVSDLRTSNDGDGRDPDASDPGDWVTEADLGQVGFQGCTVEDSSWHGTFIAGQLAAATGNATGVTGVNWAAKILPVRVSGQCGAWLSDVVDGIRWAAGLPVAGVPANPTPARIINVSFGGPGACGSSYQAAIDAARAVRSLVVVAGGNEAGPLSRPADCGGVLSVGAVRRDGLKAPYSSFGRTLGIMAPGGFGAVDGAIVSTTNTGKRGPEAPSYGTKQGTSFAAPLAAGVASLMLAANPALTPDEIVSRIQAGARAFPHVAGYASCESASTLASACNCTTASCGPGLLDAAGALQLAGSPAVAIAAVDPVAPGATVTLDGRASTASPGAQLVAYQWSQQSGPGAAQIASPDQPLTQVTLPGGASGTWVFRLLVSDSAGRSADNYVSVVAQGPGGGGDAGDGGGEGSGGGASGWWWGLGLWLAAAVAWRQRRAPLR